jgi:hypothetical protein
VAHEATGRRVLLRRRTRIALAVALLVAVIVVAVLLRASVYTP